MEIKNEKLSRDKIEFYRNPITLPTENLTFINAYKTDLRRSKF